MEEKDMQACARRYEFKAKCRKIIIVNYVRGTTMNGDGKWKQQSIVTTRNNSNFIDEMSKINVI